MIPAFGASTRYWNVADGDFLTASSWKGNVVPVAGDSVCVTNGGEMRISADVPRLLRLDVGLYEDISNRVVQTGGILQMDDNLIIGHWGSGRGYYHLSGGTVKMASNKSFCVSGAGYGYLMISGTGVADIRDAYMHIVGNFDLASGALQGSVHLASGGKILVSQRAGAAGCIKLNKSDARFYCEGGTIQADGDCPNLFFGDGYKKIDVCEGGLVIDTGSHAVATSFALVSGATGTDGGLTKKGSGMLSLSGANTYTGQTVVEEGTLFAQSPSSIPISGTAPRVVVKAGARIMLGSAWTAADIEALQTAATVEQGGAILGADSAVTFDAPTANVTDAADHTFAQAFKTGSFAYTLTGANVFGDVSVSNGTLVADWGNGTFVCGRTILAGGCLGASGSYTAAVGTGIGQVSLTNAAGFSAVGGDLTVNLGGSAATAHRGGAFLPNPLVLNDAQATGDIRFKNPINMWSGNFTIRTDAGTAYFDGALTNGTFYKTGEGTLVLDAAKTNSVNYVDVRGGRLELRSGKIAASNWFQLGTESTTGTVVQTGGEIVVMGRFTCGHLRPDRGYYYLRGGRLSFSNNDAALAVGNSGFGYVEISGTGVLDNPNGYLAILPHWNDSISSTLSHGEVRLLDGGTAITKYGVYAKTGSREYATFIMDGGVFRTTADCTGVSLTSDGAGFLRNIKNVWMGVKGGTIDTQGHTLYAAQPIESWTNQPTVVYSPEQYNTMPALVKKGTGTLRLTGANTYPCATAVDEGTLLVNTGATLPATTLRLGASGTLNLGGTSQTFANLVGSGCATNGSIALAAGGTVYPGGVGSTGTLTLDVSALSCPGGATLAIDVAPNGTCDMLNLSCALDLSKLNLAVTGVENLKGSDPIVFLKTTGALSGTFAARSSLGNWTVCANRAQGEVSLVRGGLTIVVR
jgi:autotransporter-associated beta strand protein